jgi:ribosomal protein L11 methyltransferase
MVEDVMAWVEYHITTTAQHAELIGERMTECGAVALTMKDAGNQPIYEPALDTTPPLWPDTTLVGLFDAEENFSAVNSLLQEEKSAGHLKDFTMQLLPDEDWERRCLDTFQPILFGKRLWVVPSWHTPPDPDAVNIILDPGLAFGTGTHATTALCLEWLDENIRAHETVLDYGCGSGILAVAALKLGAAHAYAVDHDPKALSATLENAERNQLDTSILTTTSDIDFKLPEPVDILVANILAGPLIELAPRLAKSVKVGGKIILSGILYEQAEQVAKIYQASFDMQPTVFKGEWVRLSGIRR